MFTKVFHHTWKHDSAVAKVVDIELNSKSRTVLKYITHIYTDNYYEGGKLQVVDNVRMYVMIQQS